jgi:hypothetical protein
MSKKKSAANDRSKPQPAPGRKKSTGEPGGQTAKQKRPTPAQEVASVNEDNQES